MQQRPVSTFYCLGPAESSIEGAMIGFWKQNDKSRSSLNNSEKREGDFIVLRRPKIEQSPFLDKVCLAYFLIYLRSLYW